MGFSRAILRGLVWVPPQGLDWAALNGLDWLALKRLAGWPRSVGGWVAQ